jgi:hypothetical protein
MKVRLSIYVYISPIWGVAPSQLILSIFGKVGGLADLIADVIKGAKFHNDQSKGFRPAVT